MVAYYRVVEVGSIGILLKIPYRSFASTFS